MRRPGGWIRGALFVVLAALLWWGTTSLTPDADRLARLTLSEAAGLNGDEAAALGLSSLRPHDEGYPGVAPTLQTQGAAGCESAARHAVAGWVNAPGQVLPVLQASCTVLPDRVVVRYGRAGQEESELLTHEARIPRGLSLLPPLAAILVALFFRHVIAALMVTIVFGAFVMEDFAVMPALERAAPS